MGSFCGKAAKREALFRESARDRAERILLGTAFAMRPNRISALPALARLIAADLIGGRNTLPDPAAVYESRFGLCGIAHDLSPQTLLAAYRRGLFPGGHVAPVKWFSPPERCVLFFNEMQIENTVRKLMRKEKYKVTFDRNFESVIKACAEKREGKWHVTWITPRIMRAYAKLHDAGYAHSFEVWNQAGELAGGGYGVAVGSAFFGESQFSREKNTSKLGQAVLSWHLAKWGFHFDDSKWNSPLLKNIGFRTIPRAEFRARLAVAIRSPIKPDAWSIEADLAEISRWRPEDLPAPAPVIPIAETAATIRMPIGARVGSIPYLPFQHPAFGVAESLLAAI